MPRAKRGPHGHASGLVTGTFQHCARRAHARHARPTWRKLLSVAAILFALFLVWRFTPLAEYVTAENIRGWARAAGDTTWTPIVAIAAYTPAVFLMFPRPLLTLFAVIAYGPWFGFGIAMCGDLLAALSTYYAGRALPQETVRDLAGERLQEASKALRGHGVLSSFVASIAPVAPFIVVGMAAGAAGIRLWHYLAGNLLGMTPGTLASTVFARQIAMALEDPSQINYWVIAGVVVFFVLAILVARRWLARMQRRE